MVLDSNLVIRKIQENKDQIRRYGVKRLGLFGSVAQNAGDAKSDLDFLVEFERKSFDAYMDLKSFLEELFGTRVDLVLPNTLKPRLRDSILRATKYVPGF